MKLLALFLLFPSAAVVAFTPGGIIHRRQPTFGVLAAHADSSSAVQAAEDAAKQYGKDSPEARAAWDIVEELDSSDNSAAYAPTLDDGCLVEEEISQACLDYSDKLEQLQGALKQNPPKVDQGRALVEEIRAIKLTNGSSKPAADSPQLQQALAAAQKATTDFGPTSPEAKVAWAEVEEVAATGLDNAMGKGLDEECLVDEALEACQALDELNKFIGQTAGK